MEQMCAKLRWSRKEKTIKILHRSTPGARRKALRGVWSPDTTLYYRYEIVNLLLRLFHSCTVFLRREGKESKSLGKARKEETGVEFRR